MAQSETEPGNTNPVIRNCVQCLVHAPDLVIYGSKPQRDIANDPDHEKRLKKHLRRFADAVRYPPNQTFIGNLTPDELAERPRPWHPGNALKDDGATPSGPFGEIVSQDLFYAVLDRANVLTPPLVELTSKSRVNLLRELADHAVLSGLSGTSAVNGTIEADIAGGTALPLFNGETLRGGVRRDNRAEGREDRYLDAATLLEALCVKASGAIALQWLLHREGIGADAIDYIISCGEEAAGDRYQRGAGGIAKSIGEMCGCTNASGMDVKNFCAGPASALVTAGALVKAGLYRRVAVVAGGSLAKLGMKSQAFIADGATILDDCLGAFAILVTGDDGESPLLHLEPGAIGLARIGASASDQAVYGELILRPIEALGWNVTDIDKFAPELHNPEIMEHAGSGDVVQKNYRIIAALAVMAGLIEKADMDAFITRIGMVGFAPTQGHIPSAMPYLPHAAAAMHRGSVRRVMFLCKASLFLNRMTELYDGVSFVVESNPKRMQ